MDVDYAIVGGGPAGLGVAIEAARRGRSALVVERRRGTVDKACGEGIMPGGVARLRELGVDLQEGCSFTGIRYVDGEVVAEADFVEGPGLGMRRVGLSGALQARADALGVIRWGGTEAGEWVEDAQGITLSTTRGPVRARWLVAADGLHSRVRRAAGFLVSGGTRRRFGVRRHYRCERWTDKVEVHWADHAEAYVTPVGPDTVGVAFLSADGARHAAHLSRFPALAERLGEPVTAAQGSGPFATHVATRVRGRVLLVGDAAGYLDAITGEGITLALECADALVDATIAGEPSRYEGAWRRITRRHLALTGLILAVARRPWLRRRVVRALRWSPAGFQSFLALNSGAWGLGRALPGMAAVGMGLVLG